MKYIIPIFRILTFLSFIFLMVPNEKFTIAMIIALIALLMGFGGLFWVFGSAIVLAASVFIFVNAFEVSRINYKLSVVAILILYFPVGFTIRDVLANPYFMSWFSYLLFAMVSSITLVIISRKLILANDK
ncbi:MAG: hypothetical protein ABI267_05800 [Ginsengibacter sp.]